MLKLKKEKNKTHNFLCWAGWLPHQAKPYEGIFIKNHLEILGQLCQLRVFTVRHVKSFRFKNSASLQSFGILSIWEIPYLFPFKFLGYLLIPLIEFVKATRSKKLIGFIQYISFPYLIFAQILKIFGLKKIILIEHWSGYTKVDNRFYRLPAWYRSLLKWSIRSCQQIFVVSEFLKHEMISACNVPDVRFTVISNVIRMPQKVEIKSLNPRSVQNFKILTIANLIDKIKNISLLISVMQTIRAQIPGVELHVVGEGPDRLFLEKLTEECNLQSQVFFHGTVENEKIQEFYFSCHVFALLSNYETFSVATAEALAHGRPVLVTRCGGPQEYVTQECGVLVNPGSKEDAVKGFLFLYDNYEKFDALSIAQYARERFSLEKIKNEFLKISF